jgi:hypothetical protein
MVGRMKRLAPATILLLATSGAHAQKAPLALPAVEREVRGTTLVSNRLPAADLTFGSGFRYVGSQVVNLYGNADAEQHLFVKGGNRGPVDAFYWVQFEHFLPTNSRTYDYRPTRTVDIGGLQFIYDVKGWADYRVTTSDSGSDGAAGAALLARDGLAFPVRAARVRMFYLPTADRRTELMIIYGEAVPENSIIPTSAAGLALDSAYTDAAKTMLDHARQALTIRRR